MESLKVVDLKKIAKSKGFRGYSKLRKAELIDLLKQSERPKRKVIFVYPEKRPKSAGSLLDASIPEDEIPKEQTILKPTKAKRLKSLEKAVEWGKKEVENWGEWLKEIDVVDTSSTPKVVDEALEFFKRKLNELHSKQSLENKKKRKREVKKAEKRKREAEKREREAEKRKRNAEKNRKKRESKKRNKKRGVQKDKIDVDIDQLVKDVEEELKRKGEDVDVDVVRNRFKLVETNSALEGFAKNYKIEEEEDEEVKKETRKILEKQIKQLKKKKRNTKDGKRKRSLQKVIDGKVKERHCPFKEVYGPKRFLSEVKPIILTFLRDHPDTKIQLVFKCNMSKTDLATGEVEDTPAYFLSNVEINFQGIDVDDLYKRMSNKMLESLAAYQQKGSNWVFDSVEELALHTVEYEPLSGSSYIPLPKNLADKKAIINMENDDDQCFKWCIARALNPVERNPKRITPILRLQAEKLNWEGLKFPMELKDIHRVETLNEICINVLGYEEVVYPLRVSKKKYKDHVNLLLISQGEKKHYCLIKNMSRLLSTQVSTKKEKKFFCLRCLNAFGTQELLDKHLQLCEDSEAVRVKMPKEGTFVYFKNNHRKMDIPFVIYADFESIMRAIRKIQKMKKKMKKMKKSYTKRKQKHIPVSFRYYVKCSFDDRFSKLVECTAKSEDEDVAQKFVDSLEKEVKSIYKDHPKKRMIFTKEDNAIYKKSESCWMCGEGFTDEKDWKVQDHCHYTGEFRGAAHNSCNTKYRRPKFTPVIFHNLSGYDAHLFIKNLGKSEGNIDCIPNNEEKYISFTKHVEVDRFMKDEKEVIVKRELRFIDSYKFMSSSLDELVNNLSKKDFKNMEKYFDKRQMELLKRKGVYPYEWLDSVERLNETQLPSKDVFYSKLSGEGISEEDYKHAQNVWNTFGMKSMREYHNLYNKTDVLLLSDVFEKFRKVCKKIYDLDPCWYYTAPGLAWDACLKLTKVRLELLTDPDMLLMIEKGVRGGISMISTRHGKANNKYMGEKFDASKPSKYITYLDANNLYGWAMSKKLPTGGFKWMTEEELGPDGWRNHPCILEVDLEYPKELHDLHNEYPLAPERLMINKVEKLIPNLNDKKRYVIHYENLKQYESLGLKITHIHRGIKFEESDWMKPYIDLNTCLRAKTKHKSKKDFFKLMNNSVFGKTMENVRKRVNITLVKSKKKAKKLISKPNFKKCTIFSKKLCAIEMKKTQIYFNKPLYLGMCILDLSKTLMYDFHYNYIKPKYDERAKLLFTDTDSLAYEIQTEDFYRDISSDVEAKFDTSDFPPSHPSDILVGANKKVVGMFKDEASGQIIEEFVGLHAKLYSYKMFESKKEKKKCKGVKKSVINNTITFDDYKRCLFSGEKQYRQMNVFRSRKHEVFTEEVNKIALSGDDDKRIILPDKVHTLAYGHTCASSELLPVSK